MSISISLLGCAHPHIADMLGVIVSESDLRLAAWDADRSAVPGQARRERAVDWRSSRSHGPDPARVIRT